MKRLVIVYNPRSSRFPEVQRRVIEKARGLQGWMILKFEVPSAPVRKNAKKLAAIIRKDDLVLSAGGDGTATMVMNAILESGKMATMAAMPLGNFNDFPETLGEKSFQKIIKSFEEGRQKDFYPLEVRIDERFYGFSGLYFTVGLMAEATRIFEKPKNRRKLQKVKNRLQFTANKAFFWYLKNKWRKDFLPERAEFNRKKVLRHTTDFVALNGKSVAGLIPARGWTGEPETFRAGTMRNRSFFRGLTTFIRALEGETPGEDVSEACLKFPKETEVFVHVEGEGEKIKAKEISVRKSKRKLRVL